VSEAGTLSWLAEHELRLSWRDWVSLMTAGRRRRAYKVTIALGVFAVCMHVFAYWLVAGYADIALTADVPTLVALTGTLVVAMSLLLSQAMESVTRAFYTRADLELILTSPVSPRKVFAVRMMSIAGSTVLLAVLLAAPFIDVLALRGGARWLAAYGVVASIGALATAISLALTVALFRLFGARRTRLMAQIVAAVIGAAFVISLQLVAIVSSGSLSRFTALQSHWVLTHVPALGAPFWWPARAVLGDLTSLAAVLGLSAAVLAGAIVLFSRRFGDHALAAAGVSNATVRQRRRSINFRRRSQRQVLRAKEWMLLRRDPWLISQTLMQILYLLPPALLLWITFRDGNAAYVVLIPVIVMAAGQLAGGLAWLTISAEDAPDFVASAPIARSSVLLAKVEAVIGMIALIFAPMVAMLAFDSLRAGVVLALGILISAAAATLIQLAFRVQAKRSQFRRRQTSSRIATFAEAFSSISWAATAAMAADGTWFALVPGLAALAILGGVRLIGPPRD
jgi:ABC-2 type transport system permease protein